MAPTTEDSEDHLIKPGQLGWGGGEHRLIKPGRCSWIGGYGWSGGY
jgi:hypothetical protein